MSRSKDSHRSTGLAACLALVLLICQAIATSANPVVDVRSPAAGSQSAKPAAANEHERPKEHARSSKKSSDKALTKSDRALTKKERLAFIRSAQVWAPTNVSEMDLRAGPQDGDAFQPNQTVACDYVEEKLSGHSRKFDCAISEGDVVKVRYGEENGEVEGSVIASRLLWALGFGADRLYAVRVICRGCSSDPWNHRGRVRGEFLFDPAAIERKPKGHEMKGSHKGGWAWPELDLVDEQEGGATKAQRDGLKLLAVFIQHTDSKAEQGRLLCLPKGWNGEKCEAPFMMLHDVGLTFGQANYWNRASIGSVNFSKWSTAPLWKDAAACVGDLSKSATGTLDNPKISEAGRAFLAGLLVQLTDQQLHDLFEGARVELRSRRPNSSEPPATVDEWVAAFKLKRQEIVSARCPS
jgi:hypothetical protein